MTAKASRTGFFLVLEGPDGTGKTTLAESLAAQLRGAGRTVHLLREPGGTGLSEIIRALVKGFIDSDAFSGGRVAQPQIDARAEALLFAAARAQLVEEVIVPALERDEIVICDRFALSTKVYQGLGRELGVEQVDALTQFAVAGTGPDVTICLEISAATAAARRAGRGEGEGSVAERAQTAGDRFEDRMETAGERFLDTVREGYRQLAAADPDVFVVSAEGSPEQVLAAVRALLVTRGLTF